MKRLWSVVVATVTATLFLTSFTPANSQDHRPSRLEPAAALIRAANQARTSPSSRGRRLSHEQRVRNFRVVGHSNLGGGGFNADVYAYGDFAYVGVWGNDPEFDIPCPATGVKVVDISRPSHPVLAGILQNPEGTTAEDIVVQHVRTARFEGDLAVAGIQACNSETPVFRGLQFFDVTHPYHPQELGRWRAPGPVGGCHEVDLVVRRSGRVVAACAVPFAEVINGTDEVVVVDATNPYTPHKEAGFAIGRDLGVEPGFEVEEGVGCGPAVFAHSVRFFDQARLLYVSYWDGGTVRLKVGTDLTAVSRTRITPPDEDGDNHSMTLGGRDQSLLLINPEDFSPEDPECEEFDGWGELYIYDNSNPGKTRFLSTFSTSHSRGVRTDGFYSIHNSEFVGEDQVFAAWYSDGIRWIDVSDPTSAFERGHFVPPAAEDPLGFFPTAPIVWGVWPHNGLILASDINSGLWILRPGKG
jgi:LVIVD repeat